jgi:hypothetical protein
LLLGRPVDARHQAILEKPVNSGVLIRWSRAAKELTMRELEAGSPANVQAV